MTDSEKAALEIFTELRSAQATVIVEGWKLKENFVPISSPSGAVLLSTADVVRRIRQIIDKHMC